MARVRYIEYFSEYFQPQETKKKLLQRFFDTEKNAFEFFDTYINVAGKFKSMLD